MKLIPILILAILFISSTTTDSQSKLAWSDSYKLNWDDFRAQPAAHAFGSALTAVSISAKPYRKNGKPDYHVKAWFLRDHSWCKSPSKNLLHHEQGHFDIAEWYARKVRRRISDLRAAGVTDFAVYNREINQILEESNVADKQYDRETLNGALRGKQIMWELALEKELRQLEQFR